MAILDGGADVHIGGVVRDRLGGGGGAGELVGGAVEESLGDGAVVRDEGVVKMSLRSG